MLRSKFFRVASSGKTVDGREITPEQIDQMAASYDPKKYGARIWMEHIRSYMPDGMFKAYGDVVALKSEAGEDGKRVLFAQIEPTPELVEINRKGQKVFSSVEIQPNFSDTNEAYLVGLAVTDSPASLGTEMIKFCIENKADFAKELDLPDLVIGDSIENETLEFSEEEAEEDKPTLMSKVKALFKSKEAQSNQDFSDVHAAVIECATVVSDLQKLSDTKASATDVTDLTAQVEKLSAQIEDLTKLSGQPEKKHQKRPASDGTGSHSVTDC